MVFARSTGGPGNWRARGSSGGRFPWRLAFSPPQARWLSRMPTADCAGLNAKRQTLNFKRQTPLARGD